MNCNCRRAGIDRAARRRRSPESVKYSVNLFVLTASRPREIFTHRKHTNLVNFIVSLNYPAIAFSRESVLKCLNDFLNEDNFFGWTEIFEILLKFREIPIFVNILIIYENRSFSFSCIASAIFSI